MDNSSSAEPTLITDLTSTDNTYETSSSYLSEETTPIVSASLVHTPSRSLDDRDDQRHLPLTSSASAVVASLESSSFTTTIDPSDILSLLSTTMLQGEQSLRFMANSTSLSDLSLHTVTDTTADATKIESSSRLSDHALFKEITNIDRIPSTMTSSTTVPTIEYSDHLMAFSTVPTTWPLTPSPMAFNDEFQSHISSQASMSNYATSHPFNTLSLAVDDMEMTPSIVVHSFALDKTSVKPWINAVSEDQEAMHPLSNEAHLSTRKRNSFPLNSADSEINYITSTSAPRSAVESPSDNVSNIRTVTPSTGINSNIRTIV
jgi:hypothetical protein